MGALSSKSRDVKKADRASCRLHAVKAMTFVARKGKPIFRPLPKDVLECLFALMAFTVEGSYSMLQMVLVCRDWCELTTAYISQSDWRQRCEDFYRSTHDFLTVVWNLDNRTWFGHYASLVCRYQRQRPVPDNMPRVIFCGPAQSGKSCLIYKLQMAIDPLQAEYVPSVMSSALVDAIRGGKRQLVHLVDTGFYDMASAHYSTLQFMDVDCAVICFSRTVQLYDVRTNVISDWVPMLHSSIEKSFRGGNGKNIILVETMSDGVPWETVEERCKEGEDRKKFTYESRRAEKPVLPIFKSNKDIYKQFLEETNRHCFSFCDATVATPDGILELLMKFLEIV